jgi:iron-sulfur cluster repair protein YtfE (RIC family)
MCDHCGCRDLTPVARLMDEHDRLRELSDHVRRHMDAGDDAGARAHFTELLVVLGPHVAKEEGALFPMLRRSEELAGHVAVLEGEHAGLYDAVDDLDDVPPSAEQRWRAGVLQVLHELDEHMYKEDFGLFPAAIATLNGSDWDVMDQCEGERKRDRRSPPADRFTPEAAESG